MAAPDTLTDRIIRQLKNHPVISVLIVTGLAVIGIGGVAGALSMITHLFRTGSRLEVVATRVIDDRAEITAFRKTWLPAETTVTVWDSLRYEVEEAETKRSGGGITVIPTGRRRREASPILGTLGLFPLVDVLLRNPSPEPAVLNAIEIAARRVTTGAYIGNCSPLVPTWAYHVLLQSDSQDQSVTTAAAQLIPPGGADRFVLVIGHEGPIADASYDLKIRLIYNQISALPLEHHRIRVNSECGAGPRLTAPYRLPPP